MDDDETVFDGLLGYHLRRLSVAVMADLAVTLAPLALKTIEASILFMIAGAAGPTQADIGRVLGVQRANMAPLIGGLVKRGLVERVAVDGRSQALQLTPAGQQRERQAWEATQAHEARMFGALPSAARAELTARLKKLRRTGVGIGTCADSPM